MKLYKPPYNDPTNPFYKSFKNKMSKEEIMGMLDATNHLSRVEQAMAIWDAAIKMAAESATTECDEGGETGFVNEQSILRLKFNKDE